MGIPMESELRRFYISLPVDDEESLDALGDVAENLKMRLWPGTNSSEERRKYSVYNKSKVHVTLWACDLRVGEDVLKKRLKAFMFDNRGRFTNLRIRFNKLSYLAKTETRYIVACLDPTCRKRIEELKRALEKAFRDLGKSLLDRDTCQLHCSIVACTNLNVSVDLLKVLGHFRKPISAINDIHPTRLIVTSKWNVLACGTFLDGTVKCMPRELSRCQSPIIYDTVEDASDLMGRTVDLINFPIKPKEQPIQLLFAVARVVGFDLEESMIERCCREPLQFFHFQKSYRLYSRSPDIVAVFADRDIRDRFLACVTAYWKWNDFMVYATDIDRTFPSVRITVNRQLPLETKLLLGKAKRFTYEHDFKYCWMEDDEIRVRKDDFSPVYTIRCQEDLQRLARKHPRRQPQQYPRHIPQQQNYARMTTCVI